MNSLTTVECSSEMWARSVWSMVSMLQVLHVQVEEGEGRGEAEVMTGVLGSLRKPRLATATPEPVSRWRAPARAT